MAVSQYLSVTEVSDSINASANTSKIHILWKSTQTGESHNDITRTAKYYVSVNGGAETEYPVSYTLPQNSTVAIVDTTITVNHKDDGSGTISVRTWMETNISAGVVEKSKSITLTTIPRASTITSAYDVALGSSCKLTWTPASTAFYYKVNFSLGSWSYTTSAFRPGTTSLYTYTGYTIPYEVAHNFPSSTNGVMTATLYTYSDSGTTQIGSSSAGYFFVTLPEVEETKPRLAMILSPVTPYEKFASLYLRGLSAVKATFAGEGKYSATVDSYSMSVGGKSYSSPFTSNILTTSGKVSVVGTATDSRGYSNTLPKEIDVIDYKAPYLAPSSGYEKVICERCTEKGVASDSGTRLRVKGTRNYTKINTDGIVNTCSVRCRYKPEASGWSHASGGGVDVLLGTDTSSDAFDVVLTDIVLDPKLSYTIELNITDDTALPSAMTFHIPSEEIAFHLREGGKGAAFGKYAIQENLFECDWDARFNKKLYHNENEINLVIEQGTEGSWHYRKWLDGTAECWGRRSVEVNINQSWGSIYYGTVDNYAFLPGLFASAPMCQITAEFGSAMQAAWTAISGEATSEYAPALFFCRPMIAEAGFDILYYAIGRWK